MEEIDVNPLAIFLFSLQSVPPPVIEIDATKTKPISPYIYGVNHPEWSGLDAGITLARQGGNRMTAYNWETNASNAGNDFHHQNDGYLGSSNEPGWTARTFMEAAQNHGAAVILTIPTAGYVSADKNGDGDVNKTPDYLSKRFLKSYARKPGGRYAYPPETHDKAVYQDEFVHWLETKKSPKTPLWFSLDNEPDLWQSTHERIVPKNVGYAGIIANNIEFASAIKAVAPKATVLGPANYGWQGFRTFQDAPDANGRDFLNVYLDAMREAGKRQGKRLLDILDIHWYPEAQGDGVRIAFSGNNEKPGTIAARIQAPRSLWDPTYVEKSWITDASLKGQAIALLPRVLKQIADHYPGTKLSITEYNYGGARNVSGMLAQADVLGIFGRYGVYAACNWGLAPRDTAMVAGFKTFANYNGKGARFGDLGLAVKGETPAENSVYASLDSKDKSRMTVVVINKTAQTMPLDFRFRGFTPRILAAYVCTGPSFKVSQEGPSMVSGNPSFHAPPHSVSTLELRQ